LALLANLQTFDIIKIHDRPEKIQSVQSENARTNDTGAVFAGLSDQDFTFSARDTPPDQCPNLVWQ
jgi:hypothetical protein